jgi:hypothetical protein
MSTPAGTFEIAEVGGAVMLRTIERPMNGIEMRRSSWRGGIQHRSVSR